MRLDLFLPFVKKSKAGAVRRWLIRIGPTWLSSPVRRAIQAICFVAFLVLFFYVCWPYTARPVEGTNDWPSHYANDLVRKEMIAAEFFLVIDPLVSLSTALASRAWIWSLSSAGIILVVCVFIPRGFYGYLCPLGTLIDLFDWAISSRVKRFRVDDNGWWVHIKYYVLLATLVAADDWSDSLPRGCHSRAKRRVTKCQCSRCAGHLSGIPAGWYRYKRHYLSNPQRHTLGGCDSGVQATC